MKTTSTTALLFITLLFAIQIQAQSWTGGLEGGGVVSVDPRTNKATVYTGKGSTQLWDGTHRLNDGSVIIVHDGIVTSGTGSAASPASAPNASDEPAAPLASSVCVELVIKVCGFSGECRDDPGCSPARQLMQLEKDEAWQTQSKGPNSTSLQCRKALENEQFFTRCMVTQPIDTPTACQRLVANVCGSENQCAGAPACEPAQQLLAMETQERLASRSPDAPTYTSKKCEESFDKSDFFVACPVK
ncbi:MAG: hypothetical protein KDI74_03595 [Gammaproteobacteria bacterium]|nr:hypothetical protein [Gammaproteobacteria bacterium]HXK57536.1 hypothetical protein [Gammaproteobacteria bacterium]